MVETPPAVRVRYWAGARAAAGLDEESVIGPVTVGDLLALLTERHPGLASVLPVCSILVDGLASTADVALPAGVAVEVLPPFAGG
ncbi:MAG: MoaD/ThiS family protein [Ornithinibacter sp.]